jgi:hypothetical protein
MSLYDDYKNNIDAFERFERTERERERQRKIDYRRSLGPVKSWRELEIERLNRLDEIWNRTTIRG